MGSESSSKFIINRTKKYNPLNALKENVIVKQITLGISNIDDSTILRRIYPVGYVHTSLFISWVEQDKFEDGGILLEFGKYKSNNNEGGLMKYEYQDGGMRYGFTKMKEFEKILASSAHINLEIPSHSLMPFKDLIQRIKEKDNWSFNSYNAVSHNCQHFCAKALTILRVKLNPFLGIIIKDNERLKYGDKKDIIPKPIRSILE